MVHGGTRSGMSLRLPKTACSRASCSPSTSQYRGCHGRHWACGGELIETTWSGRSVVELEGPHRVTPEEIAATFADLLGRPVRTDSVPRETWESLFQSQGMKNPHPYSNASMVSTKAGSNSRAESWLSKRKSRAANGTSTAYRTREQVLSASVRARPIAKSINFDEMSWRENNVRPARVDDARAIAEVHVASSRTTYKGIFPTLFSTTYPSTNANSRGERHWPYQNRTRLPWWLATWTAALWDSSPVAPRGRAGWAAKLSFTRFISSSLHNGRASERCWYSISYGSFVHEVSARWPCGSWPRILLGTFMKPSEESCRRTSGSNVEPIVHRKRLRLARSEYLQR